MQDILKAREAFEFLEAKKDSSIADAYLQTIRDCLAKEKVTTAALDPYGKKTATQMEMRLMEVMEQNYIDCGRKMFEGLESGRFALVAETVLQQLDKSTEKMRADLSILDTTRKSSSAQVRLRIEMAWAKNMQINPHLKSLEETRRRTAARLATQAQNQAVSASPTQKLLSPKEAALAARIAAARLMTAQSTPATKSAIKPNAGPSRIYETRKKLIDMQARRFAARAPAPTE